MEIKQMKKTILKFKGETFLRESDLLGDVEKITWIHQTNIGEKEVYNNEQLTELENYYESKLIDQITPELPII